MRTEVKIGIAVGAVLAIIVVAWIGVAAVKTTTPQTPATASNVPADNNINIVDFAPAPTSAPAEVVVGESALLPDLGPTSRPTEMTSAAVPVDPSDSSRLKIDWGDSDSTAKPSAASPAEAEATDSSASRTYVVKNGDSLWRIAEQMYGNGGKANLIKDANKLQSNALRVGQKLTIPALPTKVAPVSAAVITPATEPDESGLVTGAASSQRTYTVVAGDTGLYAIAKKVYGDGNKWDVIAKANHGIRSEALRVGQKLIIPDIGGKSANVATSKPATATKTSSSKSGKSAPAKRSEESSNRPSFD